MCCPPTFFLVLIILINAKKKKKKNKQKNVLHPHSERVVEYFSGFPTLCSFFNITSLGGKNNVVEDESEIF